MYQIRKMNTEDIGQVHEIETQLFSMPWSKNDFESSMKHPNNLYLVVEEDGEIVGYCGLWCVLDEGQITNVAVKKTAQNKGIGKLLITEILKAGRKRGISSCTLEVRESNRYARQLYLRCGFLEAGIRPNFYEKPTENAVIMWYYF